MVGLLYLDFIVHFSFFFKFTKTNWNTKFGM